MTWTIFRWLRPERMVKTQADDDHNTLDVVFVANAPFDWFAPGPPGGSDQFRPRRPRK